MTTQNSSLETIQDFLAQKRIAIVGVSRKPGEFSAAVFKELSRRGYDVVPVNPNTPEFLGQRCYARVQDVQPAVDAALLMTSPAVTEAVTHDCVEAGIHRIWMHRAGGKGAVNEKAIEFCRARGVQVVPGECPLMFLAGTGGVHRFHGFIRKLTGRYPKAGCAVRT